MKRNFWLFLFVPLFFSGCGDFEWFPDNSAVFRNTSTAQNPTSNPVVSAGAASLSKSYKPATVLVGTGSTLTFTITNGTGSPAQSGLGFTDQLTGLNVITATAAQCGGTVTFTNPSATSANIVLSGGQLAAGVTNCTIIARVASPTAGSHTNKSTDITGLAGGLVNGVTDQTLTVVPTSVIKGTVTASNFTADFVELAPDGATATYTLNVDVTNSGAAVGVRVNVIAVDADGAEIASTATAFPSLLFFETVPANSTSTLLTGAAVPVADKAKILFWMIKSVEIAP